MCILYMYICMKVPMMSLIAAGTGDTLAAAPATRRSHKCTYRYI